MSPPSPASAPCRQSWGPTGCIQPQRGPKPGREVGVRGVRTVVGMTPSAGVSLPTCVPCYWCGCAGREGEKRGPAPLMRLVELPHPALGGGTDLLALTPHLTAADMASGASGDACCPSCPGRRDFVRSWLALQRGGGRAVDRGPGEVRGVRAAELGEEALVQPGPHSRVGPTRTTWPSGVSRSCRSRHRVPAAGAPRRSRSGARTGCPGTPSDPEWSNDLGDHLVMSSQASWPWPRPTPRGAGRPPTTRPRR